MSQVISIYELYEITGDELGRYARNLGYFKTNEAAEKASTKLGHAYWKIQLQFALELESGEVFLLQQPESISFGLKRR